MTAITVYVSAKSIVALFLYSFIKPGMKYLLMILVTSVMALPHAAAQTFASNEPIIKNQSAYSALYLPSDDDNKRNERYARGMVVAGIISMGIGAGAAVVGVVEYTRGNDPNDHRQRLVDLGAILMVAGGLVFVDGGLTVISGAKRVRRYQRMTIISPQNNAVGLAYNF